MSIHADQELVNKHYKLMKSFLNAKSPCLWWNIRLKQLSVHMAKNIETGRRMISKLFKEKVWL